MIKVIAIDDEMLALDRIERLLLDIGDVEIVGKFNDPIDFLETMVQTPIEADLCFLDINMPGMTGLELALSLQEMNVSFPVCFTTSYSEYAVHAFELNALDYLMKPIVKDRLLKTLQKIEPKSKKTTSAKYGVRCFGSFAILENEQPIAQLKWRTSKAEELIAFLIHQLGLPVSRDKVMEILWPDMDPYKAGTNLNATTYYIRKALTPMGLDRCLQVTKTQMQLTADDLEIDLWRYENWLGQKPSISEETTESFSKNLLLYKGLYFGNKDFPWAIDRQAYYETTFTGNMIELIEWHESKGNSQRVLELAAAGLEVVPSCEMFYEALIRQHLKSGDRAKAKSTLAQFEKMLKEFYDLSPSRRILELFN